MSIMAIVIHRYLMYDEGIVQHKVDYDLYFSIIEDWILTLTPVEHNEY